MDIEGLVSAFASDEFLGGLIEHAEVLPPRPALRADWPPGLLPQITEKLVKDGFPNGYLHQVVALDEALQGKDILISTGTGSGKSLAYFLSAFQSLESEPSAHALFLYPTKALAQDQLSKLRDFLPSHLRVATYDGDTPASQRTAIRKGCHALLTNPDMLHIGILPRHENWAKLFRSLRLIVIDEIHAYRGVFGSHVANVLRRLLRLCEFHGSRPQIVACSATIGNPHELFERLTGRIPTLIDDDASPRSQQTLLLCNPPRINDERRSSPSVSSADVLAYLVAKGVKTLCFNRARITAELVLKVARETLEGQYHISGAHIDGYRGGYNAKERRTIEKAIFRGDLMGLSTTNAMELGVDIGGLDAVIMNGYPGSMSSFWQQSGRVGRAGRNGLSIYVAHDDPLEQYLLQHPELLLTRQGDNVQIHPENERILEEHLKCAAHERPLSMTELGRFGPSALGLAETLDRRGDLAFRSGLFFYPSNEEPAPTVNIRSAGSLVVRLLCEGKEIGTMELTRAMSQAHLGAVYLHRGQSYVVRHLDLVAGVAQIQSEDVNYYTRPIMQSTVELVQSYQTKEFRCGLVSVAKLRISTTLLGFRKHGHDGGKEIETVALDVPLPPFETVGVWIDMPIIEEPETLVQGLHALEHALFGLAPLLASCDRSDLGSSWYPMHPEKFRPAVFIYDQIPGGIGLAQKLYEEFDDWVRAALSHVENCKCSDGCPSCLFLATCESANDHLSKAEGLRLLRSMVY